MNIIRIKNITIKNLKNVAFGSLNIVNDNKHMADVVGLYGQNGSGKTALIESIRILKGLMCGIKLEERLSDAINIESEMAEIRYEFLLSTENGILPVTYEVALSEEEVEDKKRVFIKHEKLYYKSSKYGKKARAIVDTTRQYLFENEKQYNIIVSNKEEETNLIVAQKLAFEKSTSFIFSSDSEEILRRLPMYFVINELGDYALKNLFIISTVESGLTNIDTLPLTFMTKSAFGTIPINLMETTIIPERLFATFQDVIDRMNIVLSELIPRLNISIKKLGKEILANGEEGVRIQLLSKKGNIELPLYLESNGTIKIISVLNLLIAVYNNPSLCVAIDELDSGIFEYLLGELVRIISEKGKGQLLFTSHNLRALETLDNRNLYFTCTNPNNRYVKLKNIKKNNNLRNTYYRNIMLSMDEYPLYDQTKNADISLAMKEAGI